MEDLPDVPLKQMLSYLSLGDLIKARIVSRRWYVIINSFRVKRLCYSENMGEFSRPIGRTFAKSFIISPRFASFFGTFGPSIISNVKHLHLRDLTFNQNNRRAFARTISSFGQLKELAIIKSHGDSNLGIYLALNLPVLTSIHLEDLHGINRLSLKAPALKNVKVSSFSILNFAHPESIERLVTYRINPTMSQLKNLKHLHCRDEIDSPFLSDLKQLKEVHLFSSLSIPEVFEEKRRLGLIDLKIYLRGLLLNGPNDPVIDSFDDFNEYFGRLAENPSRLADEILFQDRLDYTAVESFAPELAINVLSRFTDLKELTVKQPVHDIQRFLDVIKNFDNLKLHLACGQMQDLLDQLPTYCDVQVLTIWTAPSDLGFLFNMKQLTHIFLKFSIDIESIREVLNKLQFLSRFEFWYYGEGFRIRTDQLKRFYVWSGNSFKKWTLCSDSNAVVEHILRVMQEEGE